MRTKTKQVLVVIPTGDYCERLKLEGIVRYVQERHGARWNLRLDIGGNVGRTIRSPKLSSYDGIIAYVQGDRERQLILNASIPAVAIEDFGMPKHLSRKRNIAWLICDHVAEGETAANYFLDRHYQNFAAIGTEFKSIWSDQRLAGFSRMLMRRGFSCHVYSPSGDLTNWLRNLPKPCALFAARDLRARQVLDSAEEAAIAVPQELAVLGVDDDEIMCTTTFPALSSIPTFDRSLGYAAGRALNMLMTGKSHGGIIQTRHSQVVTRRSTDVDAVGDPFVARALTWSRQHLDGKLDAVSLAQAIGYSPRALQNRAVRSLGTTIGKATQRLRLSSALELLANTNIPIAGIAERCGFSNTSHLCRRVREATGMTPLAYRRKKCETWI